MLTKPTQELRTPEHHFFLLVIAIVPVTEANTRFVDRKQPMITDGNFMCIATRIFHYLFRTRERFSTGNRNTFPLADVLTCFH